MRSLAAYADLAALRGIGFAGEAGLCAERGVADVDTLDHVVACISRQHDCVADRLIAAATPRAGELLALGGWNLDTDVLCLDDAVSGGGAAVAAGKRKALLELSGAPGCVSRRAGRAQRDAAPGGALRQGGCGHPLTVRPGSTRMYSQSNTGRECTDDG